MGPRFRGARKPVTYRASIRAQRLQWGRAPGARKPDPTHGIVEARLSLASMGPRSRGARKPGCGQASAEAYGACFNGAALRGARKRDMLLMEPLGTAASMGPRSRGARKPGLLWIDLSAARGFNGAALRGARKRVTAVHPGAPLTASMGPRSRGARKRWSHMLAALAASMLQWGRAPRSAETSVDAHRDVAHPCFNGAALRGARKHDVATLGSTLGGGFNGAALRGARKPGVQRC